MKKINSIVEYLLIGTLVIGLLPLLNFKSVPTALAFNRSNIISDAEFTSWQTLDAGGVQAFLNTKGGTRLRTFSEGGRSAAQIIATAAKAYRINPFVILATIQKEESLIESNTNFDYRIRWAMGYGVCDGCDPEDPALARYAGFTKQIDNGTWQLARNYSYWATASAAYRVGTTVEIDGVATHIDNRATSALYRYTPHFSGNESFSNIFARYHTYRPPATYDAKLITQVPRANVTVRPGQTVTMLVAYRNLGTAVWYKGGANPTRLGNSAPQDRNSSFIPGNVRWNMIQNAVGRNAVGTFKIVINAPQQTGTYVERFRPVMEGVTWIGPEVAYTINVQGAAVPAGPTKTLKSTTTTPVPAPAIIPKKGTN